MSFQIILQIDPALSRPVCRGVDPYGTGGHVPPISMKGVMVISPNILELLSFRMSTRVTATVVCCTLTQILCVFSQNSFSFWGTSSQTQPAGVPRPPVFFYVPNNSVRSTPLPVCILRYITQYTNSNSPQPECMRYGLIIIIFIITVLEYPLILEVP